jgi:hypothetical protein
VEQCPPVVATMGIVTLRGGVVSPVRQVDFGVHLYPPHLLWNPLVRKVWLASASLVGDSDACKAESGRGSESELWHGLILRVCPWSGTQVRFSPTGRPVGVTGLVRFGRNHGP